MPHGDEISVLVVDDDDILRAEHQRLCHLIPGVRIVGIAKNGAEAIRLTKTERPDIVLMDLVMPDIDGFVALRLLNKGIPGTRVVVLSSRCSEPEVREQCRANGAVALLMKPLTLASLEEVVQHERAQRGFPPHAEHLSSEGV